AAYGYGISVQETRENGNGPHIYYADLAISAQKDENGVEGSLTFDFNTEATMSPVSIQGKSLTMESGTINTNSDYCLTMYDVSIIGRTINADTSEMLDAYGIVSARGPVSITGGEVNLISTYIGIQVSGNSTATDNNAIVSITGGDVTISAG